MTQRLAAGDFETRIDVPQLTVLLNGLQKVANRIFSGLVLAAIIIASAMLINTRRTLGTWGFIVAGADYDQHQAGPVYFVPDGPNHNDAFSLPRHKALAIMLSQVNNDFPCFEAGRDWVQVGCSTSQTT